VVTGSNPFREDFSHLNRRATLNVTPAGITHSVQDLAGRPINEADEDKAVVTPTRSR
jgi:hypothetical protein